MEQEIKYIQIGLENVEVIDIDVKNIECMLIIKKGGGINELDKRNKK